MNCERGGAPLLRYPGGTGTLGHRYQFLVVDRAMSQARDVSGARWLRIPPPSTTIRLQIGTAHGAVSAGGVLDPHGCVGVRTRVVLTDGNESRFRGGDPVHDPAVLIERSLILGNPGPDGSVGRCPDRRPGGVARRRRVCPRGHTTLVTSSVPVASWTQEARCELVKAQTTIGASGSLSCARAGSL